MGGFGGLSFGFACMFVVYVFTVYMVLVYCVFLCFVNYYFEVYAGCWVGFWVWSGFWLWTLGAFRGWVFEFCDFRVRIYEDRG